jgi:hypothetical protein
MALAKDQIAEQARGLELPRALTKSGASARANRQDDESYALRVFGRSIRESNCDCDRSSEPSLLQTIFLANDSAVQKWLGDPKTSWSSEVSAKFGWQKPSEAASRKAVQKQTLLQSLKRLVKQKADTDARIVEVEKNGNKKFLRSLKKRRSEVANKAQALATKFDLEDELKDLLAGKKVEIELPKQIDGMTDDQANWIAENAYLRTLSRKPNSSELQTVIAFLKSEEKPSAAVESLLWSLINTKEFILNH